MRLWLCALLLAGGARSLQQLPLPPVTVARGAIAPQRDLRLYKPEVLAPAGGWPQVKAAVANGADAVYFGLQEGFNARARASNFPLHEVPQLMSYLHERGLKGYTVVNILVFDEELSKLEEVVKQLAAAGVDALIMQDVGAAAFVRRVCPSLPVHGSTQMSITDAHGATFAEGLGVDRVVVGRELSIEEITSVSRGSGAEVEAFVHGALCVSYSGQCYSSEAKSGRSANRGQCSQECRMPYGLVVNGALRDLQDVSYLLSPQDLMAVDLVPELIRAGVRSFKIEGRLKGPEYVAITTKAYRSAVDEAWALVQRETAGAEGGALATPLPPMPFLGPDETLRRELRQVFSRGQDAEHDGLSAGFLLGSRHQELVRGRNPRHRGLLVGRVQGFTSRGVLVGLLGPVRIGEGVVFDSGRPEEREEGGLVYEIFDERAKNQAARGEERSAGRALLTFGSNSIDATRLSVGDYVWKTKDPTLDGKLRAIVEKGDVGLVGVTIRVTGAEGRPMRVCVESRDENHEDGSVRVLRGEGETQSVLAPALRQPLTREVILQALGSLGDSPFRPDEVEVQGCEGWFVPVQEIKTARREAVAALLRARAEHGRGEGVVEGEVLPVARNEASLVASGLSLPPPSSSTSSPSFSAPADVDHGPEGFSVTCLCRTPEQVAAACQVPWLREVTLDFLEVHGLRENVAVVRRAGKRCVVATPRVIKPGEERLYTFYLRLRADALLVRSAGFLQQINDLGGPGALLEGTDIAIPHLHGDFSLNSANLLSSAIFLSKGVSRLTASHDLNADQIAALGSMLGHASQLEVVVYQHLPVFHTEHCVFCRFLSDGNSYLDCGKPCETNRVHLRGVSDGLDHLVLADEGCRNTIFNAKAQSGAEYIAQFREAGISRFRLEFVDEPADRVGPLLQHYHDVCLAVEGSVAKLGALLDSVPNSNGLRQGYSAGTLLPQQEKSKGDMKMTAAETRARGAK